MQIGAVNNTSQNLLNEIQWIAEHQFDYLDLSLSAPQALPERLDVTALRQALHAHALPVVVRSEALPVAHAATRIRRAALAELSAALQMGAELGAKLFVTRFQHWPEWMGEDAGIELYGQLYDRLVADAQPLGLLIALENHHQNLHQLKRLRRLMQRSPQLYLALNIGHANVLVAKNQTREYLFDLRERVVHLYLSDNDGTADDHLALGAPGRGGIDWRRQLATLRSFGYEGTFTLEVQGMRRWLIASREYLRQLWQEQR